MYCVNIVQMAGNRTISDCGSSTCAHAVIYQSVGDEDRGSESISFHHCAYYGSRGGTYYRALPTTNATTRPFTTGSSSSSSSSQNDDEGWRPQRVGAAVAGTIIAFLIICVVIPVCICSAVRKKGRGLAAGRHTGNRPHTFQPVPPTVTASPEYHRGGEVGAPTHSTLDPGRSTPWFALPQWDANADGRPPKPNANWGQEMQGLPPRYEEIGGTRVVR